MNEPNQKVLQKENQVLRSAVLACLYHSNDMSKWRWILKKAFDKARKIREKE